MGESGPTQGAEHKRAKPQDGWVARPRTAKLLRGLIFALPLVVSFGFSIAAGRIAPAEDLGMNRWLWIVLVFLLANVLLVIMRTLTGRLIPLVALMKLTLVFPDNAPSRTKAALRKSNSRTMLRSMREAQQRGEDSGETRNGDYLVQLLREVNDHDRLTRGHSERVRAYSELLGAEIGLGEQDLNKLRWAALLHDVGKLTVPAEILNKDGRPTDEEWKILSGHPSAGIPLLEPLRDWLGDWIHAADQHHCRWDGNGYPSSRAGEEISLAGRLVAIADAYDVMTSARSYKKPFSPEVARQELTDCAGAQFDPTLVRAFLRVGLGRLKTVAGPLAWLSNLTGSAQLPLPAANAVSAGAWSAGVAATGLVTVGVTSVFSPPPPEAIALDVPTVVAEDVTVTASAGDEIEIILTATGEALTFTVGGAAHGDVEMVSMPRLLDGEPPRWQTVVTYAPTDDYVGQDGFSFEACNLEGECDQGTAGLELTAREPEPTTLPPATIESTTTVGPTTTAPSSTTTAPTIAPARAPTTSPPVTQPTTTAAAVNLRPTVADDAGQIDEDQVLIVLVLANDSDPEGTALVVSGIGSPIHGTATAVGDGVRYEPPADFFGTDQFTYTVTDGTNPGVVGTVVISVLPVNDPPQLLVAGGAVDEDVAVGSVVSTATVTDPDGDDAFEFTLTGDLNGRFSIDDAGIVRTAASLDHENTVLHNFNVVVSDGESESVESIQVAVLDVDEAPEAKDDVAVTDEDTVVAIDVVVNDSDPEGQALTVGVSTSSDQGGTVSVVNGLASYTPPADFEGVDTFRYAVKDPADNTSNVATVTVTVNAVNDAPTVGNDAGVGFATAEDSPFTTGNVRANDDDVDNSISTSTVEVITGASRGSVTNNGDGTFGYSPTADLFGADTFEYRLVDEDGGVSATALVTIDVVAVNDDPVANDDVLSVANNGSATSVDLRANDTDVDGPPLVITAAGDGVSGTVVNNGDGTVTYTHDGSASTSDSFSYTVSDSAGGTDVGTVVVTIDPLPDHDGVGATDNCPATYNPNQMDTDGDGIGDACDANPTKPTSGMFRLPLDLTSDDSRALATADFDGDGDMDIVFANESEPNKLFVNGLAGLLTEDAQNFGSETSHGVAVGDLDGDGDIDLIFANDGPNSVWLNDGVGGFTSTGQPLGSADTRDVGVGDFDGDGTVDLTFANRGSVSTIWTNDGSGTFTAELASNMNRDSMGVAVGDLNSDGFLDFVTANDGQVDEIFINTGAGGFSNAGQVLGTGSSHGIVFGDLNGDGHLDIVIAGDGDGDTVWLNDGSGVFTQTGPVIGLGHSRAVDVGDIDGDGDLDIVFGDHDAFNSAWVNDGNAVFTDSGQRLGPGGGRETEGIILVDLNNDGDLGIVMANSEDVNGTYGGG